MKALVVDFEGDSRKAMMKFLAYLGFDVYEAADAKQAQQHLSEHR